MNKEELEKRLSSGEQLGFARETEDPEYLGWVLISKRTIPPGTILDPNDGAKYLRLKTEMDDREKNPYHLKILELNRKVHESGAYESSADYKLNENYYYHSLIEVENELNKLGFNIDEIKKRNEIDPP